MRKKSSFKGKDKVRKYLTGKLTPDVERHKKMLYQ